MKIKLPMRKPGPPLKRPPKLKLKASVARSRRAPIIEEEDFLEEPEPNMKLSHAFVVVLVLHVIAVAGVFAFNSIKARQADIFSAMKDAPAKAAAADTAVAAESNTLAADPSNGPAQAAPAAQQAAPAAADAPKTHALQPGETLTKVATAYGVSVADLETVNGITDPTKIRAGTVLTIPYGHEPAAAPAPAQPAAATYKPLSSAAAQPAAAIPVAAKAVPAPAKAAPVAKAAAPAPVVRPAAPAAGGARDSGIVYTVAKGDVPEKIAKKFKVSYAELMKVNGNPDPTKLQIGQKLKIPAAAK